MASIGQRDGYDLGGLGQTDATGAGQQSWQDALAQQNAVTARYPVDPANGLHYSIEHGKKLYFPPIETPQQYLARIAQQGHGGLTGDDQYTWNQNTGKYEHGTDWLKVATLVAGGADAAAVGAGAAGVGGAGGGGADTLGDAWAAAPASAGGAGISGGAAAGTGLAGASGAATTGTGAAAAPVVAGAAGPAGASLWTKIAAPLVTTGIQAATGLVGTKMQIDANKDAAAVQADYLNKALDWQKQELAQRRTDLAPAINTGGAATYKLGDLMGLQVPGGITPPPPPPPHQDLGLPSAVTGASWSPATPPAAVQPGSAATGNQGPVIQMRSPSGTIGWVPVARKQDALNAGGQVV